VPAGDGPRHAVVDLMSRNEFRNIEAPSTSSLAGAQASFFVDDAGHLNAWCSGDQNHTNRTWVTYTNTILSATNWSRLSVAFDYTSDQVDGLTYYRVAMNGVALPVPGGRGYACNRGRFARSPDGVWLVSANPAAKQVNSVALDGSGLLDDLVVQTNELAFLPFPQPIISTPRSTLFIVR
jgi:hypothetical protein